VLRSPTERLLLPEADVTDLDLRLARRAAGSGDELSAILSLVNAPGLITFSGGFPAPEIFPSSFVRDLVLEELGGSAGVALQYTPTEGLASFRTALATWIKASQGTAPDALMVTSGGIAALQLICRTLLDPGDRVLVESPTYLGAITAFSGFEARIDVVAADDDGLDPTALAAALATGPAPKLLYVIPDFQNPTGAWLSTERRHALVALARQHGLLVVEDVAYRELGFTDEQRPSLWSLAPDVVVQVGTFSKILFPGVRLGWAAGPAALIPHLVRAKQNSDQCASGFGQWLAESFLLDGGLDTQLPLARRTYAARWAAMDAGLTAHLPPGFSWTSPAGGFFTWVTGPPTLDTAALLPRARELGVAFVPGAPFYAGRSTHHALRLAFSATTPDEIAEGTRRLGLLLSSSGGSS
jgi:2-aminoadipate transaminase